MTESLDVSDSVDTVLPGTSNSVDVHQSNQSILAVSKYTSLVIDTVDQSHVVSSLAVEVSNSVVVTVSSDAAQVLKSSKLSKSLDS